MRLSTYFLSLMLAASAAVVGFAQELDMADPAFLANAHSIVFHPTPHDLTNGQAHSRFGIFGIDSNHNHQRPHSAGERRTR